MKQNKYKNIKVEEDGITFDSKMEACYYKQVKWLHDNKQILFYRLQPKYLLQEAFEKNEKKFRAIYYIADFEIHNLDGSIQVVDIKGHITTEFAIKRKLFEFKYPHRLVLITYDDKLGFVETEKLKKIKGKVKPVGKGTAKKVGYPHQKRKRTVSNRA